MWKLNEGNVENFVETVENLFFAVFYGQHNHYKGYILKMQDFLPKKRRFFKLELWKNNRFLLVKIEGERFCVETKTEFSTSAFYI